MPGELLVDQAAQQQVAFIDNAGLLLRIDRRTRHPGQNALPNYSYRTAFGNPPLPDHGRLIPDFFLSQSSSIFSFPISLYSRSGSRCAATGVGPRLPSNSVLACS